MPKEPKEARDLKLMKGAGLDAHAEYLERRATAIAEATSRPAGKPKDGATYGKAAKKET